jgi:hypothetical protein
MKLMFQSTNIELANVKNCTNITNPIHKRYDQTKHVIKTLNLINFDGIYINQQKQMNNAFHKKHNLYYLSCNHHTTMINEYITTQS